VYEYVSNAVKAGSTAFNNLLPRDFSHAFEDFSTRIPVVAKQVLNIHMYLQRRNASSLSKMLCLATLVGWIEILSQTQTLRSTPWR
jgi:hypothetical protein